MTLTESQLDRYLHHIVLKDVGGEGQKKLLSSRVLVVGAGGLGSPAALYLAAAGVGTIGICDADRVELSNLQRQILYTIDEIGKYKADSARTRLKQINSDVRIDKIQERLDAINAREMIADYDFVIDGSDNFDTKFLISDMCLALGRPFSFGGVVGFKGQAFTHAPGTACLRCIFPEPPPAGCIQDCRGSGILGAVAGIIGSIQATEAMKFILGKGSLLTDRILTVDALGMEFCTMRTSKGDCAAHTPAPPVVC